MSVYAHVLLFECVQKVIVFMGNALAVQSNPLHPSRHIFPRQLSRPFVSNMYICYLRHSGANVRRWYLHSKCNFSSSLAVPGISLFRVKGAKNGGSDLTTIRARVKYIVVGNFRQIGRGLNNVLLEPPQVPPIRTPYLKNQCSNSETNSDV